MMSSEIVEIEEDRKSTILSSRNEETNDVYVAVGKNDLHVVKWTLDHAVPPGGRIFLVHVFPPVTYIPTPAGKLSRSRLSDELVQVYVNEESNRRKNLLEKYIRLCNDAKVVVDTMLLESKATAKAILDLISVVHITCLVMGSKRSSFTRLLRGRHCTAEYVQRNAPEFCNVTIVDDGKRVMNRQVQHMTETVSSNRATNQRHEITRFSEWICFPGKKYHLL